MQTRIQTHNSAAVRVPFEYNKKIISHNRTLNKHLPDNKVDVIGDRGGGTLQIKSFLGKQLLIKWENKCEKQSKFSIEIEKCLL